MKYWRKPLDSEKYSTPKGDIHIIPDRCKGCGFCIEFCPNEVFTESEKFNVKGYHPPEINDGDKCIGCRLCELICPEFSIYIVLPEDVEEESAITKTTKEKKQVEVAKDDKPSSSYR
jgi:2-oxoglutarate ferredoxin oxidoreductase subunit delta